MRLYRRYEWWALVAIVYSALSAIGAAVNYIGQQFVTDSDGIEIAVNILTNTQAFFTEIFGLLGVIPEIDFLQYSGFHLVPYFLGGLTWILYVDLLWRKSERWEDCKERLSYLSSAILRSAYVVFLISMVITAVYSLMTSDPFSMLLLLFFADLYVPLLIIGLIFGLILLIKNCPNKS